MQVTPVATEKELTDELQRALPDLVISDFNLRGFTGRDALRIVKNASPSLPFIVVSGEIGEEIAVDMMRCGASDYCQKHKLKRLPAAVVRELERVTKADAEHAQILKLEQQVQAAQRMESVGRLAGGVAHDFNNLLTAIFSFTRFAMDTLDTESEPHKDLQEVLKAAERAQRLTEKLLAFSRRRPIAPEALNPNDLLSDLGQMLDRVVGEDIKFIRDFATDLAVVRADRSALEQVFINLVVNARDAMPNGGRITITTQNVELTDDYFTNLAVQPRCGSYVRVRVEDTGIGMSEDVRLRIFEPFFTTKTNSGGTGLGLATCYGLVKQAQGYIWVESQPHSGTTFTVDIPTHDGTQSNSKHNAAPQDTRGTERILLCEDDEQVRIMATRTLGQLGYRVVATRHGREALKSSWSPTTRLISF